MEKSSRRIVQGIHGPITYILTRKQVKNVNLRIHRDGEVHVSAHRRVPVGFIDEWIRSKEDFIRQAQERYAAEAAEIARREAERQSESGETGAGFPSRKPRRGTSPEDKARALAFLEPICQETWKLLQSRGITKPVAYPTIRVRTMTSRWGSCIPAKNVITLNTRLLEQPLPFVEYVVLHEFAHFTHPDHSGRFYGLVEELMPDWRERKRARKEKEECEK